MACVGRVDGAFGAEPLEWCIRAPEPLQLSVRAAVHSRSGQLWPEDSQTPPWGTLAGVGGSQVV